MSGGPYNIHFCFPYLLIALLVYLLLLSPGFLQNSPYLLLFYLYNPTICSLVFYSHINSISSLYSRDLIIKNLIHIYLLQKNVELWSICTAFSHAICSFFSPCFLKLPPDVSFVPPFRLLFNFKMADFYVISIS